MEEREEMVGFDTNRKGNKAFANGGRNYTAYCRRHFILLKNITSVGIKDDFKLYRKLFCNSDIIKLSGKSCQNKGGLNV